MLPLAFRMVRPTLTFAVFGAVVCASTASAQDFKKDVVPFLDKYCYECHDAELAKGHLNLEGFKDDSRFFRDQRIWREVVNQVASGEMPPAKKKTRPSSAEIEALQTSVHKLLAAAIAKAKTDPGDVTIRRLNRAEFNHTIRDLCFLDENFSADFPADDTGYGFDNIGDVLTFSPVHLERFLSVGEAIAAKAMPVKPSELEGTGLAMIEMLPRGKRESQQRFFDPAPTLTGPMTASRDGDYVISVALRSTGSPGDPPAKVAFLVDGREVGTYQFKQVKKTEVAEAKVTLKGGVHEFTLKWLNPPAKITGNNRTLSGLRLRLLGPADTRTELQRRLAALAGKTTGEVRARLIANSFVSRAFRRPATPAELARYVKVFLEGEKNGGSWEAGAQAMIAVVLASPKFIFRAEQDEAPTAKDAHPVSEFALASRLSYFLWGSMPDDELFQLAYAKKLSANLEAQTRRLLKDPRSRYLTEGFGLQWLQLRQLSTVSPDPAMFPGFNDAVRVSMMKETELFFEEIVREDRSVLDLIDADFTYLDRNLAAFYGIPADIPRSRTSPFVRVTLPKGERGGILTHASILTATSNPTRTSPVKRGKWILEQILGSPPPPAPPSVPTLEGQQLKGNLRQRMEQHRADPACASCHTRMDAIGFAFEKFDAVGQLRQQDEGQPIDPSGKLPDGRAFSGAGELKKLLLADKEKIVRNLSSKLLTFGLGRGLDYYDGPAVDKITESALKSDARFSALVLGVVQSDPFRLRRGTSQVEGGSESPKK
ncbi:MAG: hypothetical protein RLZZ233_1132 [Verrucomicrobiota bacterium]|jgi:hypothetical protein